MSDFRSDMKKSNGHSMVIVCAVKVWMFVTVFLHEVGVVPSQAGCKSVGVKLGRSS
jgi:hypothetical protein